MKKFNILLLPLIGLMLTFTACSDFGDLNEDPNNPIDVPTSGLFTNAEAGIEPIVGRYFQELYVQHMSEITYTEDSRYQTVRVDFNPWYNIYLADLQQIIDLNSDAETAGNYSGSGAPENQIGLARILKAYLFGMITDRWGPVPYTEALQGRDNLSPKYDDMATIYAGNFKELKEAAAQLDSGKKGVSGDFIFNGDMDRWRKFANTLRALNAMRIVDVDEATARAEFLDAMAGGFIETDAMYPFINDMNYENPWFTRYRTREDYAITTNFVQYLEDTNDPRLNNFADPTKASQDAGSPEIVGVPYGLTNPTTLPSQVSFPNSTYVRAQTAPLPMITMSQVHMLMAEAAARNWTSEDAETHYNAAVKASWDQWGVSYEQADLDSYLAQDGIKWDGSNWKEVIAMQKWVSLYAQGLEAWNEFRRFDIPALDPAPEPLNRAGVIPTREIYPTTEASLNEENYNAALQLLGGTNDSGTKLWWDVN